LDVKEQDIAASLVAAVDAVGLTRRTIACARTVAALRELRDVQPSLRRAWSIKRVRHAAVAHLAPAGDVPAAVATALREGLAELVSVHRSLVTARLVEMVRAAVGEIYVWDVGSAQQALALSALGVDALIGDDPKLLRAASILRDGTHAR
jgi:glycerophosphoryl diester phosphodiesterase